MKDKCNGKLVTEFIGLRSKVYCLQVENEDLYEKAKGVKSDMIKRTVNLGHLFNSNLSYRDLVAKNSQNHLQNSVMT